MVPIVCPYLIGRRSDISFKLYGKPEDSKGAAAVYDVFRSEFKARDRALKDKVFRISVRTTPSMVT